MPDEAKHTALVAQGFQLARVCETCEWWQPGTGFWGRCALATYQHAKHTDEMKAGTPRTGTCSRHATSHAVIQNIAGDDYAARYLPED